MTVKELIKKLEKCNLNAEVYVDSEIEKPAYDVIDYTGDQELIVILGEWTD